MRPDYEVIALDRIDLNDRTFQITTERPLEGLNQSINDLAVINPPLLFEKEGVDQERRFGVVYGFRRIAACRCLGWDSIDALLAGEGVSGLTRAKLAITDNISQRPLNLVETSRALNLLAHFFETETDLSEAASSLGLPDSIALIRKIKPICGFAPAIQQGLLDGPLTLPTATALQNLDEDAACRLAVLFTALQLSLSKQREVLTLVKEIAHREDVTLTDILGGETIQQIMNDSNLDRSKKTRALRTYLKKRRFPTLASAEKTFKANWSQINPGKGLDLIPPPYFEGDVFTLRLQFKTAQELLDHNQSIRKIATHPVLETILAQN